MVCDAQVVYDTGPDAASQLGVPKTKRMKVTHEMKQAELLVKNPMMKKPNNEIANRKTSD